MTLIFYRSAIPWAGSKSLKMWSMLLCAFCLFSGVSTIISPIVLVCDFRLHHICARTPDEIGNSTGQVGQDLRGRIPGVSAAFNPRAAPHAWFSEGVSLCIRTGSTLAAMPKAAPADGILARSESPWPVLIGPQGTAQKYMGRAVLSNAWKRSSCV